MAPHRSRRRAAVLFAAASALAISGCTAEKKNDAAGPSGSAAAPPVPKIAPGVTADTIKIGITYPDLASVRQYVNVDHGDYEAVYNALIKKINDAGGINGRKIVPVYGKLNIMSPAAVQETCVKLTQDEKVFAVLNNFTADEPLCYVQQNKTALVGGQITAKRYAQAQVPWFGAERGGEEAGDGVRLFAANNGLAGKKIAVISNVNDQGVMKETVVPALQKLGVTPVETAVLDAPPTDPAAVGQQINVFLQKFQAAGADTVVLVSNIAVLLPPVLEQTKYRPQLLFTQREPALAYVNDKGKHDLSTLLNAASLGLHTSWTEPANQECVATVEAAIPDLKGKLVDPETLPPGSPTPQTSLVNACRNVALFKAITEKAGKDLNYETFQNAGFSLGPLQIPGFVDKATYTRDTPHGAIPARLYTYNPATQKLAFAANQP